MTLTDALVRGYRLPTPTAVNPSASNQGSNKVNGPASLFEAVGALPTPLSSARGRRLKKRGGHDHTSVSLEEQLLPPTPGQAGLRLNPCFVEWMMGWPENWTSTL